MSAARQQQEHYAAVSARLRGPVQAPVVRIERKPVEPLKPKQGQFRVPPKPEPVPEPVIVAPAPPLIKEPEAEPAEFFFSVLNRVGLIQKVTASYYGIRWADLVSERRTKEVALARQVAFYISKSLTMYSLPRIGRAFRRDHTTALHSIRKIERLMGESDELAAEVATILAACGVAIQAAVDKAANASDGR